MIVTNPFSPGAWTRKQIDNASRNWWVLSVRADRVDREITNISGSRFFGAAASR